ncbi:molybdopterin cofactor-binding domain-containing protein [Amycolatopsis thermoflava]|uniref:xanthine dehydrogenase family protein molybdopterin-binding subunit n=2 Tax=Amycolatopsis TaxID=1813 RepID=UPI003655FFE5
MAQEHFAVAGSGGGIQDTASPGLGRRRFLTYLVAAPVLTVATRAVADTAMPANAAAAVPSLPSIEDLYDVGDALHHASLPTLPLVQLQLGRDGTAHLDLPRTEMGQGIVTAVTMMIADELDLPMSKVHVSVSDARPELLFNQLTAGSSTIRIFHDHVRTMAAIARARLIAAAARTWRTDTAGLTTGDGAVHAPDGRTASYASLSEAAAALDLPTGSVAPKTPGERRVVGTRQGRTDALDAVTGRKKFVMDIMLGRAKPALVRRPPTIKGTVRAVRNADAVKAMPGVVGVVPIRTGVAVVADTIEQARRGVNALDVEFAPGPVDDQDNASILRKLKKTVLPFAVPPLGAQTIEAEFDWAPACHAPLETECAVADVRPDSAEIWAGFQAPIAAQQEIALMLGLPQEKVTAHVVPPGGAFGRKCFFEPAIEAAQVSQVLGIPVRLMWHRTDDMRHGRQRPQNYHKIRATVLAGQVISYEQRVAGVALDVAPGFGEILTHVATSLPPGAKATVGKHAYSQALFELMVSSPYNFGVYDKLLTELPTGIPTSAYRSVHCPTTRTSEEIVVDEIAAALRKDPIAYRKECAKNPAAAAVLDEVSRRAEWGKKMPPGFAQGVGFHEESRTVTACVVELDGRDPKAPRVTKLTMVVDIGTVINPSGLEAQMQGCVAEAISLTLTAGLHIEQGLPLEGSYSNYHWLRMRHYPKDCQIHIMPGAGDRVGGAGEVGITAPSAAIANAYAAATGIKPRSFPLVFDVDFTPFPPGALPAPPLV